MPILSKVILSWQLSKNSSMITSETTTSKSWRFLVQNFSINTNWMTKLHIVSPMGISEPINIGKSLIFHNSHVVYFIVKFNQENPHRLWLFLFAIEYLGFSIVFCSSYSKWETAVINCSEVHKLSTFLELLNIVLISGVGCDNSET